ncbi:EF hand, partial [Opisthorchis viverrini]
MAEFRRGFHTIDRNNTGKITMEDLRAYMHRMNYKESFVVKWMKLFKPNEEGVITYENYCNTLGLIPRRPESVASDISEATFPETPHIEPHSSTEDSETTHANNAVTGVTEVFDQHAVEATVSQTQTVPGDVGEFFAPKECRLQKKTKKSPRDPKHKLSNASKSLLSSDLTDTSKELEFEHGECASLSEPESVDLSHVPAMPSQLDIGMLLDRPSETSSSTKAQAEFPGDAALEFRQPFSSDPQVHTTFADDPVDIPIFSEREESTFTNVVKSSKRKRSTSKSKEKRKQRLRGARSESDKNSTEEISTVETPSVTEFPSQLVNQNSGTLESAELYVSYQLPVFQIPDMPTIPDDVTAEHNGVEKRETDHQSRDIFGEEQSTEEQSKGGKEKREHEDEVPPTAPDNGNITYEDNLFFESARSAELGPENMNIADVAMISSECEYVIDQSVTNLGENEIVGIAVEPNGAEKTKPAVDLKQTKGKAKRRGKYRADGSRSASESENLQSDKLPPEAASTTAISVEFEPMSTDHITTVQVESEKAEFARPKSPADVSSDVYHISSDIPPESKDTSEAEQTISAIPKGHKSKQPKVKSKEKGKKKGEVLLSASESERSRDGEILTAPPVTEDMEEQKKTEPFESTEDVPPLLTGSTLGDRKREAHREQLTDDASTQMVTHRFPRSFETQPNPEKSKSQVRKRRRAVERLVKYRADQVNRVQRPKTKKKAKRRLTALDRWKVRSSLRKRGVIVILLGGRHRGKRVVSLGRQKSTGLLLVTGPFRYNGCPLRRVHPNMVLATETRVDLGK